MTDKRYDLGEDCSPTVNSAPSSGNESKEVKLSLLQSGQSLTDFYKKSYLLIKSKKEKDRKIFSPYVAFVLKERKNCQF